MEIYLVGGSVRDALLNLLTQDRDWVVVGATPEALIAEGYQPVGKDFPVFLHPKTHEEYALARIEKKVGKGYTGFTCFFSPEVTLEQDLSRRDLTINAIAKAQDGKLIDPFGGIKDINARVLRHVSPAFVEDPLRVLRVARFAARFAPLGFTIAPETQQLMADIVAAGELNTLTPERVWKETEKALSTQQPATYFAVLRDCGALDVLFPELAQLFLLSHHTSNLGEKALQTLTNMVNLTPDIHLRFAALCHDIHQSDSQSTVAQSIKELSQRLKLPAITQELTLLFRQFYANLPSATNWNAESILHFFDAIDIWRKPQRLGALILCCRADLGLSADQPFDAECFLNQAYELANAVEIQPIIEAGFKGAEIREALNQRRKATLIEHLVEN